MQVVNYSHARNNLKSLIDTVCDHEEEVIITTKNDKNVMVISLDQYNRTFSEIRRSVQKSLAEIDSQEYVDIDKAFETAMGSYRD